MLPISMPILVVTVIWQFTNIWNDFLFGASFAAGEAAPITVALNNIVNTSTGVKEYNVDMASAMMPPCRRCSSTCSPANTSCAA